MPTHNMEIVARCRCGKCELALKGKPIVSATCYCSSCQKAALKFEGLSGAEAVRQTDGGTPYVLQRKDRVHFGKGTEFLREYRLSNGAPNRRVVATCCNSPMFLEFKGGHWLSVYRDRLKPGERPATEMRTMTRDRPVGVEFNDMLPSYNTHSVRFMWRLFAAWAAMGFRSPKVDHVTGVLDD